MKRLILLAAVVGLIATGCEKTEIQNEVITPISFSSNVGKQTKAIMSTVFDDNQTFGVYAYGYQDLDNTNNPTFTDIIMNNVEIEKLDNADEGKEWKAKTGTYYWPNDDRTSINFYAYSPYCVDANAAPHRKLNGTLTHDENGFDISGYTHTNMYVDFMVATPAIGKTYSNVEVTKTVNGQTEITNPKGTVQLVFNHKMTQIGFEVALNKEYTGVIFKLENITLKNIANTGVVEDNVMSANQATGASVTNYQIYPALKVTEPNGAPSQTDNHQSPGAYITTTALDNTTIYPVTMIPQTLGTQEVYIKYTIEGTGVADETVEKTITIPTTAVWAANKKITYSFIIGLNEIYFSPSITDWDPDTNSNTTGIQSNPIIIQW